MINLFLNKKGFTLIELLIAVVILYLCLPPFFNFLTSTIFNTKLSSNYSNAIILGEKKFEELMAKDFNSDDLKDTLVSNDTATLFNPAIDKNQIINNFSSYVSSHFDHYEIFNLNNQRFYIFWNITDDNTISSIFNYKRIIVIVYWIELGKGHKITFESIRRST